MSQVVRHALIRRGRCTSIAPPSPALKRWRRRSKHFSTVGRFLSLVPSAPPDRPLVRGWQWSTTGKNVTQMHRRHVPPHWKLASAIHASCRATGLTGTVRFIALLQNRCFRRGTPARNSKWLKEAFYRLGRRRIELEYALN